MVRTLWLSFFTLILAIGLQAQSFDVIDIQDVYRGKLAETIKAPIRIKNNSDKTITLIIHKIGNQIGTSQKNYFCLENDCLDAKIEDYTVKIEPGQTLSTLQVALEAGLAQGVSTVKYVAINKFNPSESYEFELNFAVEDRAEKENIYTSNRIILHDVYPNPVTDYAFIKYRILDRAIKARIVLNNILGNAIEEFPLPAEGNEVKIRAEALNAGIYFYTLYLDNEGVVTRKLILKK